MSDQLQQLKKQIQDDLDTELERVGQVVGATQEAREIYRTITSASANARMAANSAAAAVAKLQADDTIYPEGRTRLIREAREKGVKEVEQHRGKMKAAMRVLDAHLQEAALPRLDAKREMAARDELRLLLDNSPSPGSVMLELAQRDDELGAIAVSSYGESYLRARGVHNAKEFAGKVRAAAAHAAINSSDPNRRAAATALKEFGGEGDGLDVGGVLARTNYLADSALDSRDDA